MPSQPKTTSQLTTEQLSIEMRNWNPPAARITIDDPQWHGYTFVLILYGLELAHFEIQRDADATPLNAWRLQRVPLGLLERAVRAEVNTLIEQWDADNPAATTPLFPLEDWPDASESPRANRDDVKLARLANRYVANPGPA